MAKREGLEVKVLTLGCPKCGAVMRNTGTGELFCDAAGCDLNGVHFKVPVVKLEPVSKEKADETVKKNVDAAEAARKAAKSVEVEKAEPGKKAAEKKAKVEELSKAAKK